MKSGFRIILDIIKKYGMRSAESVGLVLSNAKTMYVRLRASEVNAEYNTDTPLYNFIYIPSKYFSLSYVSTYLTKLEKRGIILSIVDGVDIDRLQKSLLLKGFLTDIKLHKTKFGNYVVEIYYEWRKNEFKHKRNLRIASRL